MKNYDLETVPLSEIDRFWEYVNNHPECFDQKHLIRTLKKYGCKVVPDPYDATIIKPIVAMLKKKKPFSVIRINDGEANFLAYGAYPGTINLDKHVVAVWLQTRLKLDDNVEINEIWFVMLRELMMESVLDADIIGCRNLSKRIRHFSDVDALYQRAKKDNFMDYPRGSVGAFRAISYIQHLAASGRLKGKIIGSGQLYFSILDHLNILFRHVSDIICISSQMEAVENLQDRFPQKKFTWIPHGQHENMNKFEPSFILNVESNLSSDLTSVPTIIRIKSID